MSELSRVYDITYVYMSDHIDEWKPIGAALQGVLTFTPLAEGVRFVFELTIQELLQPISVIYSTGVGLISAVNVQRYKSHAWQDE